MLIHRRQEARDKRVSRERVWSEMLFHLKEEQRMEEALLARASDSRKLGELLGHCQTGMIRKGEKES